MEQNKITLYSYAKSWKVEKKIYSFQNITLPAPVNLWDAVYYGVTALCIYVLQKIIPDITRIPVIVRLGILPWGIMHYVRKVKLDGKNPIKYFTGYLIYLVRDKGGYLERFTQHKRKKVCLILKWDCSMGRQ